jgi:hypothetical protein
MENGTDQYRYHVFKTKVPRNNKLMQKRRPWRNYENNGLWTCLFNILFPVTMSLLSPLQNTKIGIQVANNFASYYEQVWKLTPGGQNINYRGGCDDLSSFSSAEPPRSIGTQLHGPNMLFSSPRSPVRWAPCRDFNFESSYYQNGIPLQQSVNAVVQTGVPFVMMKSSHKLEKLEWTRKHDSSCALPTTGR